MRYVIHKYPTNAPEVEMVYPLATPESLDAVDVAVRSALRRLRPDKPVSGALEDGLAVYDVEFRTIMVQIFLQRASQLVARLQVFTVGVALPDNAPFARDKPLLNDDVIRAIASLLQIVDEQIAGLLRAGVTVDDLKPSAPKGQDMRLIFNWQRLYHPEMTDDELANAVHLSPQTIRNERSRLRLGKRITHERLSWDEMRQRYPFDPHEELNAVGGGRVPRGKPRGVEEGKKERHNGGQ